MIKYLMAFLTLCCVVVLGGLLYIYSQIRFEAYKIIDYKPKISTQIFDRNGDLVANIFEEEHRLFATNEEIPARVIEALVAIEDTAFFEHSGINVEAIFRALIKDIKAMKLVEGASTITQQLIKNTVLTRDKTITRKINEVLLSFKIESELTKEQIISRYLNHVYFGRGYYGVKTASLGYFNKKLSELTLREIAILVGLPKAPSVYDPTRNMDLAITRSNQVLSRMRVLGWISEDEYIQALNETPKVYTETLTQNKAPYVVDEVIRQLSPRYSDLRSGGYEIYLSIDLGLQELGQNVLIEEYEELLKRDEEADPLNLNGALIATQNQTGEILAMVGGVNYTQSNFNRVTQSNRQPGSSFKPFIYQEALDFGYSPSTLIPDISRTYVNEDKEEDWRPRNYNENFEGLITLKRALVTSSNLATINLLNTFGLDVMHRKLKEIGFLNLPQDLTIGLGSFGISPLKYSAFFSIFANDGEMVEPILVKRIVDRFGNVKEQSANKKRVTSSEQNFLMVDILKDVVDSGTGRRAKNRQIELAGKTGTTNNNVDAWFCGFSPEVEVIVWYGNDDNTPMHKNETGGRSATTAFGKFMKGYVELNPQTRREFRVPNGVEWITKNGKKEYFTTTSPLPKEETSEKSELIF